MVTYADPGAWIGHHDLVTSWSEAAAPRASADLEEVLLFGPATAAMLDWLARMGLEAKVRLIGEPVAGFLRWNG